MFPSKLTIPKIEINFDTPNRERFLRDDFPQRNRANYTVLGRGSYGVVIKAAYKGQHVAVKIVEKHRKYRCRYDSLRNEANVLGLKHENVVRVLKIISGARYGLVIMERFDGYCLQSVLNRGYEVTIYHRLLILCDIINGLCFCHRQHIVHLDVKPQNVIICVLIPGCSPNNRCSAIRNYTCKLCDFGSSIALNKPSTGESKINRGTIRYMAPELLRGLDGITDLADVYSFGVTMWQLSEGKDPYESIASNEAVAYNVVKKKIRPDSVTTAEILRSEPVSIPAGKDFHPQAPRGRKNSDNSMESSQTYLKGNGNSHISFHSSILISSNASDQQRPSIDCSTDAMRDVLQQQGIDLLEEGDSAVEYDEDDLDGDVPSLASLDALFVQTVELHTVNQNYIRQEYRSLYKKCWQHETVRRPTAADVRATLHGMVERIVCCK